MDDIGAIQLAVKVNYTELTGLVKTANQTERVLKLVAKDFAKTGNQKNYMKSINQIVKACLLYTSPSPRDRQKSRMPSSA